MNEASWPIFIAAPFIVPSASTIRSAASRCDWSSASAASSFERTRLRARVPGVLRAGRAEHRSDLRRALHAARRDVFLVVARHSHGIKPGQAWQRAIAILAAVDMANDRPTLEAEERPEQGSAQSRRLRRAGYVPGIVYGGEGENTTFKVGTRRPARRARRPQRGHRPEDRRRQARPVIVKDQQNHPVRGEVMHLDLLEVNLREKIQAPVRVELVGADEAPGVDRGRRHQPGDQRAQHRGAADRHPGSHHGRRLAPRGRRHAAPLRAHAARGRRLPRRSRRDDHRDRHGARPRSRRSRRSRRRPSSSARTASRSPPRTRPRATKPGGESPDASTRATPTTPESS